MVNTAQINSTEVNGSADDTIEVRGSSPSPLVGAELTVSATAAWASAPTPLAGADLLVGSTAQARASAPTPLQPPEAIAEPSRAAMAASPTPLQTPEAVAEAPDAAAWASAPSPLEGVSCVAEMDWMALINPVTTRQYYQCVLTGSADGLADARLRIKSWQATLQMDRASFLQCVVPGTLDFIDAIEARRNGDIVLIRGAEFQDGTVLEQEMARTPMDTFRYDRGPTRASATLSGYADLFGNNTPSARKRTLTGVRTISSDQSGLRVRTDIDLLLRPGRQADATGYTLDVRYINYFVNNTDAFMDVGERAN